MMVRKLNRLEWGERRGEDDPLANDAQATVDA